ncbi:MAG: hypothetical protein AABX69_03075 [Nanoarchaeota archaeon]
MATIQQPPHQPPKILELRLLDFNVSENWRHTNPHDALQKLLETNVLWGDQFRYGWAESSFSTDKELMSAGAAASQPRGTDDSLVLFSEKDSRDFYAHGGFFEGRRVVVVYALDRLQQTGPRSYRPLDSSALVAIVRPVFKP